MSGLDIPQMQRLLSQPRTQSLHLIPQENIPGHGGSQTCGPWIYQRICMWFTISTILCSSIWSEPDSDGKHNMGGGLGGIGWDRLLEVFDSTVIVDKAHEPELMVINGDKLDVLFSLVDSACWWIHRFQMMLWNNHLNERNEKRAVTVIIILTSQQREAIVHNKKSDSDRWLDS